jgi:tetratricopeptide (TPR) repeat protein
MKGRLASSILLFLVFCAPGLMAVDSDLYSSITDLMNLWIDPNTGLTSFPSLNVPLGGISEGMGTAYAAMSMDTGFIESNPAASSLMNDTELSFYHHNWISNSKLEGVVYSIRFNDLGIGFGGKFLYVDFGAVGDYGQRLGDEIISESVGTINISYNLFSSYYFSGLALGANLKFAYRSIPDMATLSVLGQSAGAIMADIGMQTSFNFLKFYRSQAKNFSVGIVVKNLGVSSLSDEVLPAVLTAGIGWSPLRPWTIAVDYNYPFSLSADVPAESWNLAAGTTVTVTDFLSVQAGFLLKPSDPRISIGADATFSTMSLVMNYNLALSNTSELLDRFSVQASFNLGDSGRGAAAKEAESLYLQGVEEYANGNYAKAIELWKKVLEIDPKYTPAADFIKTVQQNLDLQQQLQSISGQ